ncbi:hypothetical protein [Sphingopyxis panaciterrulae]|uniref:Lipoprotein n=1 Tax=Sphingopyxis panaciterrulae TaxID=462372 RepID=A0A7W9B5J8_9SPHN|nr:hypothetical protein [Sphingopyxis panaciterrulae]MBB5706371.1 hypothetical protein [Sphingopyxis panaciterrulae]
MNSSRKIMVVGLLASVAACAPKPPPPPPPPPEPVVIVVPPRPTPPNQASLTQILPMRGLDGRFVTMNSNISGDRAFWQLKIALNVAAIGCRGIEEPTLVAAYNNIIKTHAKPIKSTEKTVIADLRKETGTNGIAARDKLSTKLFNYFAQPPAQRSFCSRANEIAQIVSSTPSAQVVEQAPANLAKLDEPFVDFYESYAKYQAEVAAWDAKYAPPPVMTTPTPASVIPVGPVDPAAVGPVDAEATTTAAVASSADGV